MTDNDVRYKETTVLLVEDDDIDAMGVERALRKLKVLNPLVRARDGLEALEWLREPNRINRPYMILLDLNMPRMNGLEMLEELRKDPDLSSSVVFVLTTSEDDHDLVEAYKEHVAGYIVKRRVENGFLQVVELLDRYWRVVELPATV